MPQAIKQALQHWTKTLAIAGHEPQAVSEMSMHICVLNECRKVLQLSSKPQGTTLPYLQ